MTINGRGCAALPLSLFLSLSLSRSLTLSLSRSLFLICRLSDRSQLSLESSVELGGRRHRNRNGIHRFLQSVCQLFMSRHNPIMSSIFATFQQSGYIQRKIRAGNIEKGVMLPYPRGNCREVFRVSHTTAF